MWNDPAIQSLNPGVTLPNATIDVVHRKDSSGTTNIFTTYLVNASNGAWVLGSGTSASIFPSSELSGAQNSGVATVLSSTPDSIGYIEFYYAAANNITYGNVENQAGQFVTPSLQTISAAANAGAPLLVASINASIVNLPGSGIYPISSFTYIFVYHDLTYLGYNNALDLVNFISWCVNKGQVDGPSLYYPELPSSIVTLSNNALATLVYNGTVVPIYPQNQ
jgi:phosphate transport system substrate-binding protein